jgi:hypothetical protein
MDMPIIPGLADGATSAPTLAELLGAMSEEDCMTICAEASRAMDAGELADVATAATPQPGDEEATPDDPMADPAVDPAAVPEAEETPADEAAETPDQQAAEAAAGSELHTPEQYSQIAAAALTEITGMKSRIEELLAGAQEHAEAGLDTSSLEEAQVAVEEAFEVAESANELASEAAKAEEPDMSAVAGAAHQADAALQTARAAVANAEATVQSAITKLDDPALAAMRTWASSAFPGA